MDKRAFSFNSDAKYRVGGFYPATIMEQQSIQQDIHVSVGHNKDTNFPAIFPDPFNQYSLPYFGSDKAVHRWHTSHPMFYWKNHINFAVWCATTRCGVAVQNHLSAKNPLIKSLYLFHVYYQVRRIFVEIKTQIPEDNPWANIRG